MSFFSFSWGNKFHKDKQAVGDISLLAGVGDYHDLKRPSVVYLIEARRGGDASDSPVFGFDVYEVRPGNTTPENPTCHTTSGEMRMRRLLSFDRAWACKQAVTRLRFRCIKSVNIWSKSLLLLLKRRTRGSLNVTFEVENDG
jgi:hypothetical protein